MDKDSVHVRVQGAFLIVHHQVVLAQGHAVGLGVAEQRKGTGSGWLPALAGQRGREATRSFGGPGLWPPWASFWGSESPSARTLPGAQGEDPALGVKSTLIPRGGGPGPQFPHLYGGDRVGIACPGGCDASRSKPPPPLARMISRSFLPPPCHPCSHAISHTYQVASLLLVFALAVPSARNTLPSLPSGPPLATPFKMGPLPLSGLPYFSSLPLDTSDGYLLNGLLLLC